MNQLYKNVVLWLCIVLVFVLLINLFSQPRMGREQINFTEFLDLLERGEVSEVLIQGDNIQGTLLSAKRFKTFNPGYSKLIEDLREKDVIITGEEERQSPWTTILISWFPMIVIIAIWIFLMRQMQVGGGKAMSFGKSRAKLLTEQQQKVTFEDVAGIDEAKEELEEIIEFLKDPKKFTLLGGRIPKGVILMGAPGTGKTLLARAIAGEAGVPFFSISGSDFVEMFVGVGASRVRDLFMQGKKNAPCIIFIDEIDAVGRHRGAGLGGGHDEREQTLNQLLVEMDGFESNEGVILIAATNRPDVLDPALLRPGRFDRRVVVPLPDIKGRKGILAVHSKNKPMAEDVDLETVAKGTPGFCGADLSNLVNEAALMAARKEKKKIDKSDFEVAKDKVLMGVERKSMIISPEDKENTAYHEVGHVLVAKLIPGTDPIHKVTIIPRGWSLGQTHYLPDERYTKPKEFLMGEIAVLLGGRAAEEIVRKDVSTGAGNDLERATDLARKMVCDWGMSETLGPLTFGKKEEQIFLGREIAQHRDYSEDTAIKIDEEVRKIVMQNYERAKKLLSENLDLLHRLAKELLDKEVLDNNEIEKIIDEFGGPIGEGTDKKKVRKLHT
ncbi:MAG: cell division protein FtsH [Deltaproteobacteria bacterium DG_8]|nr:MAG: cell division protein FtsH [Deltaproteobacteria bacterium DG_8]